MAGLIKAQGQVIAASLAATDPAKFPIELIVPIAEMVLQLLAGCWNKAPQSADAPSVYVGDHYNSETGQFDEVILGQVRGQTRKSIRLNARHDHGARLRTFSEDDISAISSESLKHIMTQEPALCNSCIIEATMA
jgi:hypothetical protein